MNSAPLDLGNGVYWLGVRSRSGDMFHCNTYLIYDGNQGIIIDPGPVMYFQELQTSLEKICPISSIIYMVLQHQDPDVCSNILLWEEAGFSGKYIAHWRSALLIQYLGPQSPFITLNTNQGTIEFGNNRVLKFIFTPYMHSPGAMVTYDETSGILFSSDMFGAIGGGDDIIADEQYIGAMKTFHESYIPNSSELEWVLKCFHELDISKICPQHGNIISQNVYKHIKALGEVKDDAQTLNVDKSINYQGLVDEILVRLEEIWGEENAPKNITVSNENDFFIFFDSLFQEKGIQWLSIIQPFVVKLCARYSVPIPPVYSEHSVAIETEITKTYKEVISLKKKTFSLQESIIVANDGLILDKVTSFYNEKFFTEYLESIVQSGTAGTVLLIRLDRMKAFNTEYGPKEGDKAIGTLAYILQNNKHKRAAFFRMNGPIIACLLGGMNKEEALPYAQQIRNNVALADNFIKPMTVSISVSCISELSASNFPKEEWAKRLLDLGKDRLRIVEQKGPGSICSESEISRFLDSIGSVLLIENSFFEADFLKEILEMEQVTTKIIYEGGDALKAIDHYKPDVIISELFIPQLDAFQIRKRMLDVADFKDIPFIIISQVKTEDTVLRAFSLGIHHYYKKPYMLTEIKEIVKYYIQTKKEA